MKYIKSLLFIILSIIVIISCSQFGDSLRLPGENPKDIVFYELDNDYLAPESKEFIELNYPSNQVNLSYVLVGKNTYGFEADLDNEKSLSKRLLKVENKLYPRALKKFISTSL